MENTITDKLKNRIEEMKILLAKYIQLLMDLFLTLIIEMFMENRNFLI